MQSSLKGVSVGSLGQSDLDGYLVKKGGSMPTWKKRWCVLKDAKEFYFKTPKALSPQGVMDLNASSQVREVELKKRKHAFEIATEKRTFLVCAESDFERTRWMEALNKTIRGRESTSYGPAPAIREVASYGPPPIYLEPGKPKAPEPASVPRRCLAIAQHVVPFLAAEESAVAEFWKLWYDGAPENTWMSPSSSIDFRVAVSADMNRMRFSCAGPQTITIGKMVDFLWNVGVVEAQIDRLNDIGAETNPEIIGTWVDVSATGGTDTGWQFCVDMNVDTVLRGTSACGKMNQEVKEWVAKHEIKQVYYLGRDCGVEPIVTELSIHLPGATFADQLNVARDAFASFHFPAIPDDMLKIFRKFDGRLDLSIAYTSDRFVRLGLLLPTPNLETVVELCGLVQGDLDRLAGFEGHLNLEGPSFVECQYLNQGFGYGVYREGFDIMFHYALGSEKSKE